jgi:hypothetical protein
MLTTTTRLALALAVLASSVMAFLTLRSFEQFAGGMDWDHVVATTGTAPQLDDEAFLARVEAAVTDTGATLTHLVDDRERPGTRGVLYQASAGEPERDWLERGHYPAFSAAMDLTVRPLSELGDANRSGYWFVNGDARQARGIADALEALGMETQVIEVDRAAQLRDRALGTPISHFTWLAVFLLVLLTIAGVLTGARTVAVQQLQGRSLGDLLAADLLATAKVLLVVSGLHLGLAASVLGAYNQLHWFTTFLLAQTAFAGVVLLGMAVIHAATLGGVLRMDVLARVKGELRSRPVHLMMYGARLTACVMALGSLALMVQQEALATAKAGDAAVWASTRGNVQLGLRASETPDEQRTAETELGTWLDARERAGELVLVRREPVQYFDVAQRLGLPLQDEIVTVNSTYLRERPIRDPAGDPIAPDDSGDVLVLVPEGSPVDGPGLVASVSGMVDAELHLRERTDPDARPGSRDVRIVETASGQDVFAYLNHVSVDQNPYVEDPIVIVLPSARPIFAPGQWAAYMSSGQVILLDEEEAVAGLEAAGVMEHVGSVTEVETTNATQAKEVVVRANLYRMNLLAVLAAMLATAVGFAVVHSRRHAQAVFAQHIHGWSFLRRHRTLLLVDAGLVVAGALQWARVTHGDPGIDAFTSPAPPPPLWIPVVVVAAALMMLVLALAHLDRALISRRAAD